LSALADVPDPRCARGLRHNLPFVLAVAALATLRGARSLSAIGETAAELNQTVLARLGATRPAGAGEYRAPSARTISRMLASINRDAFDKAVGTWVAQQVERDTGELEAVAVDGKTLRGSRQDYGQRTHLLSAYTHQEGAVVAQRDVGEKGNEITEFEPLLNGIDLAGKVVTGDALHTQRAHATYLAGRGAHYVFGLKENQPKLAALAAALLADADTSHETHERGHGRVDHRYIRVADIAQSTKFPGAAQVIAIDRERDDLAGRMVSKDTSYYVTSLSAQQAPPAVLARIVRGHWGIENGLHWVRDWSFDEDRCTVRSGSAPQVLASLRNLAISLLRRAGHSNIASGLRWAGWDIARPLGLLGV
jgi:predicted transposase YbfD/YdcC